MHGGAIGFASKAGVGSTFSFYVKSRRSALRPDFNRTQSDAAVSLSIRAHETLLSSRTRNETDEPLDPAVLANEIPHKDLHVLIVEDNLVNQRVLAKQLRNTGMQVAVANHGGEALDYLRTTKYCISDGSGKALALILMDWEMPVLNGIDCTKQIREFEEQGSLTEHLPIIVTSANARPEQIEVACSAGAVSISSFLPANPPR